MPITPSKTGSNSWIISYSIKVDGDLKIFTEEFIGTIKDAMLHEKQLRKAAIPSISATASSRVRPSSLKACESCKLSAIEDAGTDVLEWNWKN